MDLVSRNPPQGTTFTELGTIVACLDEFTAFTPARPFAGLPGDCPILFGHDIRLSLVTAAPRKLNSHAKQVMYAASFLAGPALAWYHALLRENVAALWTGGAGGGPRAEPTPHYWSSWPFVIRDLGSLNQFLKALEAEFPERTEIEAGER